MGENEALVKQGLQYWQWESYNNKFPFYLLSHTLVSVLTLEFTSPGLGCIQPAPQKPLFQLYTSSAYPRPNFKSTRAELRPGKTATESWARLFQAGVLEETRL